jgi:hypothetical protein
MLAIWPEEQTSGDSEERGEQGFTVLGGECEEASRAVGGETEPGNKPRKVVAVIIGAAGPWALNQIWIEPAGQSEQSGALKVLYFINGSNPGRINLELIFGR